MTTGDVLPRDFFVGSKEVPNYQIQNRRADPVVEAVTVLTVHMYTTNSWDEPLSWNGWVERVKTQASLQDSFRSSQPVEKNLWSKLVDRFRRTETVKITLGKAGIVINGNNETFTSLLPSWIKKVNSGLTQLESEGLVRFSPNPPVPGSDVKIIPTPELVEKIRREA